MDLTIVAPKVSPETSAFLERSGISFERAEALSEARGEFTLASGAEELPRALLEALWDQRNEAEVVLASRDVRGAAGGTLSSRAINRLLRRLLDLPCFDVTSPVHLYRTSALRRALPGREASATERLVRLVNAGFKIKEVPWNGASGEKGFSTRLWSLPRWRRLRRSPDAADADDRTFARAGRLRRRKLEARLATIVGFLEVDVPVLDVGCGSSRLIQTRAKGVGLDRDPAKLRFLRGRAKAAVCGDLASLPFRDRSFPQLVLADVPLGDGRLSELGRVLRPHGTLVVAATLPAAELGERLSREGFAVDETRRVGSETIVRAVLREPGQGWRAS